MKKQILIAVDGTTASYQALEYVAFLFGEHSEISFVLLHCVSQQASIIPTPDDPDNSLLPSQDLSQNAAADNIALNRAQKKLIQFGVQENRITLVCQQGSNVAKTVQHYAERELVDSVILARRGVGKMAEMLLGSVSSSLFVNCRSIPLWVVDGKVLSKNILIGVDGSPPALMAVDHLAHIFSNRQDLHFYLFNARTFFSPPPVCEPENFYKIWGKQWCDSHLYGEGCLYDGPTELLIQAGIPKKSITTLPQPTVVDECSAVLNAAKKNNCGTVILGRRPARQASRFFGSMSQKAILRVENMALWLVG